MSSSEKMRTFFVSVPGVMTEISFCEAAGQINIPLAVRAPLNACTCGLLSSRMGVRLSN